jgi:hypothetical protein
MRLKIATAFLTLAVSCYAWSGEYLDEREMKRQMQETLQGLEAEILKPLHQWEKERPVNCNSDNLKTPHTSAILVAGEFQRRGHDELATFQMLAGVHLDIADSARKRGCLDFADGVYRYVISTFIGAGYAAHRQRAQIGLDDIRAVRTRSKR